MFIDGLPVGSLESIKKQKAQLGREKDIKDIKIIDDYIKNRVNIKIWKYEIRNTYRVQLGGNKCERY